MIDLYSTSVSDPIVWRTGRSADTRVSSRTHLPGGPGRKCAFQRGFTLIELLVVIAIISILAAIIFPVFATARGKARQTVCTSNLKQIGMSFAMYADDYDGLYPYAVDPVDKKQPQVWQASFPDFAKDIPALPYMPVLLQPYIKSAEIFHCPSDINIKFVDFFTQLQLNTDADLSNFASSYQEFGTSYYYRTEISARHAGDITFQTPSELNVLFDGAGKWHGDVKVTNGPVGPSDLTMARYNVLFGDHHVKSQTWDQLNSEWRQLL